MGRIYHRIHRFNIVNFFKLFPNTKQNKEQITQDCIAGNKSAPRKRRQIKINPFDQTAFTSFWNSWLKDDKRSTLQSESVLCVHEKERKKFPPRTSGLQEKSKTFVPQTKLIFPHKKIGIKIVTEQNKHSQKTFFRLRLSKLANAKLGNIKK